MRFRIALALSLSIILIVMASWNRFAIANKSDQTLSLVQKAPTSEEYYNELLKTYTETENSTPKESKPLTNTDLIGRQLIMDYIDLASSGQASEKNLSLLANKYIDAIPSLNNSQKINFIDIKTTTNTRENFQKYSDEMKKIYRAYISALNQTGSKINLTSLNSNNYSFAVIFRDIYENISDSMRKVEVPASLVETHVQLINIYLANVSAMEAISRTNDDSTMAMVGMITLNDNLQTERSLYMIIEQILILNDINVI